ncbi:hypothetical protein ACHWQZ_G013266 [Mnemiopsis leidyi]
MHFCSACNTFSSLLLLLLLTFTEAVFYSDRTGTTCFSAYDENKFYAITLEHRKTIKELEKFAGCEIIIGNLILRNITDPDGTKLQFFSSVKKITGYIAVFDCEMPYLPFPNLQIISGQNLIPEKKKPKIALFVSNVRNTLHTGLNSLREVSNGHVLMENNSHYLTGYSNKIMWDDILLDNATATVKTNSTDFDLNDFTCHPDCKHPGRCWGPELESCQDLSMQVCQDQCNGGRCYFAEDSSYSPICCHKECSGGCTGMTNADCIGCKNFNATGQCVTNCPPPKRYDKALFKMVDNPDVLYGLGNECLEECPIPFLVEEGNCVKKCSDHLMTEPDTNKCVPCPKEGCPKRCDGFDSVSNLALGRCNEFKAKSKKCSKLFQEKYTNCTIIEGNIDIDSKFTDKFGTNTADALEALSTVEEITGYLSIHTNNLFTNFRFLRNLKIIRGRNLKASYSNSCDDANVGCRVTFQAAITVQAFRDYRLRELGLNSLELIENGMVIIYGNQSGLCYLPERQALAQIMKKPDLNETTDIIITNNVSFCRAHEKLCHDTCIGGCWGPGPSNCFQCTRLSFEGQCVSSCNDPAVTGLALYEDGNTCKRCHPECDPSSECTGPESNECHQCRNFKDGPYCVAWCPIIKFTNESKVCMECHEKCTMDRGCTGPNSFIGPGGCNFCEVVILMEETFTENNTRRLWGQCEMQCPDGQYPDNFRPYPQLPTHDSNTPGTERVKVCTPCHEHCSSCRSYGSSIHVCTCKYAQDGETCVGQCPEGKWRSTVDKICRPCDGPCPNNCISSDTVPLDRKGIVGFANCNLVEGSIIINYQSWTGPNNITTADLEALDEIVTITGRLIIRDSPDPNFTSLDMFRRLAEVKGESTQRKRRRRRAADDFVIEIDNNTALETAELVNLKKIGGPMKLSGSNLCYVDRVDWGSRLGDQQVTVDISESSCENKPCHSECSETDGCLGPDRDMCITCKNKEFEGVCTPTCQGESYDDGTVLCKPCHENCNTCSGPGNHLCLSCKHVFDGAACVTRCSDPHSYVQNKQCVQCSSACEGGCDGPGSHKGVGGCTTCKLFDNTVDVEKQICADKCPAKSYKDTIQGEDGEYITVCEKCHEECAECDHWSDSSCSKCVHVRQGDRCQAECDQGFYQGPDKTCLRCDKECAVCIGPGDRNCTACENFELPSSEIKLTRTCVEECPDEYSKTQKVILNEHQEHKRCVMECEDGLDPHTMRDEDYCKCIPGRACPGTAPRENSTAVAVAVGVAIVFIIAVVSFICWKRAKQNQKKRQNLLKHAQQMHDNINPIYEPVMQEDTVYPLNDGQLLIVTEDSLEIGEVLGSGAFGKVYEGRWHPAENLNTTDNKGFRVAIKILKDSGDPESTREFFDEAVVMGKLDHKHLVRILCLCAGKMMLVTQLMPLGSLLDYVRKHKSSIKSRHLLTYGLQIARGMAYLEENNVVHRDLAARNVLVQTPTFVKITDFGLAKCLSSKKQMFTSEGGKLPIKWLAIESLKYRQFTSHSDVWSYGVTIWEVLEFGQLPWRTKPPAELIRSLEMGERLPKPKTCTLEVYALMLRCWVLEPTARPNFESLECSMDEFLKEPNRFVHTPHNNRASTEGSFLSPHASVTSEYRDSGIVDVDRNYENDDRAMAMQRALYDATSSLRPHENSSSNYDPALTADQDDVFSESPSTARNSVIENRHDYVQDYLVPDQYSVDEGNGTDSSQDQGYVKMNGSDYADLEQQPEYSNADALLDSELTQSLLEHSKQSNKNNKNKFPYNRIPSPRPTKTGLSPKPTRNAQSSPRVARIRDDGYSSLKEPLSDVSAPLTGEGSTENL